jgi:phosphoribosylamine--glycine ligase
MKVLVLGSGAREHALVWKALQSPVTTAVYCGPGNAGTEAIAVNVDLDPEKADAVVAFVAERGIDLTVIGPDAAVAAGVADALEARSFAVFGPTRAAGRIESSKAFAKELMARLKIPTPAFRVFEEAAAAKDFVSGEKRAMVVKADGLARGKGVFVPGSVEETLEAIDTILVARVFGAAGARVVVEERLEGREVSLLAFSDGARVVAMVPACDYKRAFDGDHGPNTGGMGAYSPPGFLPDGFTHQVTESILAPVIDALAQAGTPYRGCLYAGLILPSGGGPPQVLEFNARWGDPEAQVILPRLEGDLIPLLQACARGALDPAAVRWRPEAAVGVVLAARGYPGVVARGLPIIGLAGLEPGVFAFHAATAMGETGLVTDGGRVLTVVAMGATVAAARERVYRNVEHVRFEGMMHRTDIAQREVEAQVA